VGTDKRARQKANREIGRQQVVKAESRRKYTRIAALAVAGVVALVAFVWIASNVLGDDEETPDTVPTLTTPVDSGPVDTGPLATTPTAPTSAPTDEG
jgi:hypothetical protein